MLAVITALGYLAFHTLLWETEARYGQIILPSLLFTLASIPKPVKAKAAVHRLVWRPAVLLGLTCISVLGLSHVVGAVHRNRWWWRPSAASCPSSITPRLNDSGQTLR